MPASWSIEELTDGWAFSASTAALAKNGTERELDALAGLEVVLRLRAQPRDPGDVGLDDRGQLRLTCSDSTMRRR